MTTKGFDANEAAKRLEDNSRVLVDAPTLTDKLAKDAGQRLIDCALSIPKDQVDAVQARLDVDFKKFETARYDHRSAWSDAKGIGGVDPLPFVFLRRDQDNTLQAIDIIPSNAYHTAQRKHVNVNLPRK